MINFYIYSESGQIIMTGVCSQEDLALQQYPGGITEQGEARVGRHYRASDGTIVDIPPCPEEFYIFSYDTKTWIPDLALAETIVREKRQQLLLDSDWTQLPDVPEITRIMWVTYRQALRDITEQEGFPLSVVYPVKP
jgi:hypothetical protein